MPDQERGLARLERLRRREDFLAAARGRRVFRRAFVLQRARIEDRADAAPRFGLTVTKKVGGAVERNRIKRRLRSILRTMPDMPARAGHDYVIVARREALYANYADLADDLRRAIVDADAPQAPGGRGRTGKRIDAAAGVSAAPVQDQATHP